MKKEITSHPAPSLLNYNNLTHMARPLQHAEREGRERRAALWGRRGLPALGGDNSSLLLAEVRQDCFDVLLYRRSSVGAC